MNEIINSIIQWGSGNKLFVITFIMCFLFMCRFARLEWKSISKEKKFKDFKPAIISTGVLGTFIGIAIGLWNFDAGHIEDSVPNLLEGLKLAFLTSILGMAISIILSYIENQHKINVNADSESLLRDILIEQRGANQKIGKLVENNNDNFTQVNESLTEALDTLSKGATEHIISALKEVITDFNKNLTEQFGDNFKQLNEAVYKMIEWQENYKVSINQVEKTLQGLLISIEKNSDWIDKFNKDYQNIVQTNKDLQEIIEVNNNQIQNIEKHIEHLKNIGEEADVIFKSIQGISNNIQNSLSEEVKGVSNLRNDLRKQQQNVHKQFESSLGQLNQSLTTLTDKFRRDYENLLEHFANLNHGRKAS